MCLCETLALRVALPVEERGVESAPVGARRTPVIGSCPEGLSAGVHEVEVVRAARLREVALEALELAL